MLRMFLREGTEPRANLRYVLAIDGTSREGATDARGCICVSIPPDARKGLLTIFDGNASQSYPLRLGAMDPMTEQSGIVKRLTNLGFLNSDDGQVAEALRKFQLQRGLPITGELDSATVNELRRVHGS